MKSHLNKIKDLISNGNLDKAIKELGKIIDQSNKNYNDYILLSNRFKNWKRDKFDNAFNYVELKTEENILAENVLYVVEKIEEEVVTLCFWDDSGRGLFILLIDFISLGFFTLFFELRLVDITLEEIGIDLFFTIIIYCLFVLGIAFLIKSLISKINS